MDFKDKIVLVTGGTKGLGKSMSLEFLEEGAKVLVVYSRDEAAAMDLKKSAKSKNLFFFKGWIPKHDFTF